MEWNECVEKAKEHVASRDGKIEEWNDVLLVAKELYWKGKNFKSLKEKTIKTAKNKCKFCGSSIYLTAHHINYGIDERTICLCLNCHEFIHYEQFQKYGKTLEIVLNYWNNLEWFLNNHPDCIDEVLKCRRKILNQIEFIKDLYKEYGELEVKRAALSFEDG